MFTASIHKEIPVKNMEQCERRMQIGREDKERGQNLSEVSLGSLSLDFKATIIVYYCGVISWHISVFDYSDYYLITISFKKEFWQATQNSSLTSVLYF